MGDETSDLEAVMGFSGFGKPCMGIPDPFPLLNCFVHSGSGRKSAMKFDLEILFEESKRTAKAYSQQVKGKCVALVIISTVQVFDW